MLRPLVNQPQITLFMATIGLTFFLEGLAQTAVGRAVHGLDLGIPDVPIEWLSEQLQHRHLASSICSPPAIAGVLVAVLALLLPEDARSAARCARWPTTTRRRSRSASRCSASGPWSGRSAGLVALVAGLLWGARNGVQFALTFDRAEGAAGADPRRLHLDRPARSSAA